MRFLGEQTRLLDQWAEGPHLEVPVWRVLKCQCHTCHPAWLQLAVIVTENLSVSWCRGRTSCLAPLPALTETPVSSLQSVFPWPASQMPWTAFCSLKSSSTLMSTEAAQSGETRFQPVVGSERV